jgi:hypothetical protein
MKRIILAVCLLATAGVVLRAQRERVAPAYLRFEVHSLFPREVAPGQYQQVDSNTLQGLADQGWELVSVMPYVYRNEERGPAMPGPRAVVTQTYPAYFFKRTRVPTSQ